MTMDEYMRWLENRIAVVGTELEALIHARQSLERAQGEIDKAKPPQVPKEPQPRLTLAQAVANRPQRAKPKLQEPQPQNGFGWQESLVAVLALIRVALPEQLTSGEVINRYYAGRDPQTLTKREKDRVYAALSYLKSKGDIKRSQLGQWSLMETPAVSATLTEEKTNG